ncbi:uncharacterized protein LOC120000158 isoform X4 [Tripterygium wilfordii]|uniref:uncharacterized protein LOC120000158 isoform X4 n=1 Tax=Tripterygium wilfordii TaxID=458696 RepID=UPI0018F80889|nr:uncharacterized protein LOC120000158 isoform X4 [Tripterygium wilfordii]
MDYEVEFRSYTDNAWYSVRLVFEGEKLTVKYRNFSDDQDDVFEPGGFNSLEELEEFQGRFRPVSPQLQDSECHKVVKGMVVCAAYTFNPNDVRFYDAIVDENAQLNPMVSSFLEIARKKYGFVSHMDNPIRVSSSPLKRKSTFAERLQQGKKCAKRSPSKIHPSKDLPLGFIAKETQDSWKTGKIGNHYERIEQDADIGGCNRCHVVLINNLDKELSPSTIMEFIHKQTLVSIYAHVLPSSLSETFTSALIVSDCKENLEKLCEFLESPDHIITSARGRPWVVTQKFSWHDACRMSHEKLMFKSQNKIPNRIGGIGNELQVVHSGTGKYRTAKELRDLFMEFANHQQQLHKRLAAAEAEISRRSV